MVLHHDKLKLYTDEVLPRWIIRLRLRVLRDMENSSSSSDENEGHGGGNRGLGKWGGGDIGLGRREHGGGIGGHRVLRGRTGRP